MQRTDSRSRQKISITKNCHRFDDISAVKLKRTDTTLDLSQKAKRAEEKKRRRKMSGEEASSYTLGVLVSRDLAW